MYRNLLVFTMASACLAQTSTPRSDSASCEKIQVAAPQLTSLIVEYHVRVEQPDWSTADVEAFERRLHRELDLAGVTDAEHRADVPNRAMVHSLNRSFDLRIRETIDLTRRQVRREQFDLRDLDTIAAEYNLGPMHRLSLDQSRVELLSGSTQALLLEHADRLALLSDNCADPLGARLELLGFGSSRTDPALQYEWSRADSELVLTSMNGEEPIAERRFDDHGRLVRRTNFHAGRPAHVIEHQNFREFDGVWLPALTHITETDSGRVETRRLQSAVINPTIAEPLFQIPKNYRIQDSRDPGRLNEVEVVGGLRETFTP